jgi:hypothetical protein
MDLRPAGDACLRAQTAVVAAHVVAEVLNVFRTLRAWADEAHLAPEDVDQLGKLVQ